MPLEIYKRIVLNEWVNWRCSSNLCFCHFLILVTYFLSKRVNFEINDGYVISTMLDIEGTRKKYEIVPVLREFISSAIFLF